MIRPIISVIIPAFNLQNYIEKCLRSILSQSFCDWECIVVDDGSTDETVRIVKGFIREYANITLIQKENGGVSSARNIGMMCARGEGLVLLDGDDFLHPAALSRLASALHANMDAAVVFGTFLKVDEDGLIRAGQKSLKRHTYPSGNVTKEILCGNFIANGGHLAIRQSAAMRAGWFNTALKLSEDWEYWCRLSLCGKFIFLENEPEILYFRMRAGSASKTLASDWNNYLPAIQAVLENTEFKNNCSTHQWNLIRRSIMAAHLWEAGRVNFSNREFFIARKLMLRALCEKLTLKMLFLFFVAQISQATNHSFISRLKFNK